MLKQIKIEGSERVVVLTGSGVSAESGIPTFRGPGGFWEGLAGEDLATERAFFKDPQLVWRFYSYRRGVAATCKANPGHVALAELQAAIKERFTLCTQNVDRLHELAGSKDVLHMHGDLFRTRCSNRRCDRAGFDDARRYESLAEIPNCPCGAMLRPDVVWFGEVPKYIEQIAAALGKCTTFVAIGTSGLVYPAADFARSARGRGAKTVYVGLQAPENLGDFDEVVLGKSGELLPGMFEAR